MVLAVVVSLWLAIVTGAAATETARVTEFRLPTLPSYVGALVAGPDGEMWFAASYIHDYVPPQEGKLVREIDRISSGGQIGVVASPQAASALARGPEDSVWFANEGILGRVTADGHVTEFPLRTQFPTTSTVPEAITEGLDGNIWFTGLHYLGNAGGPPESVEVIGRLTPAGQVSEYTLPGKELGLTAITAGPDGNVWFTESNANKIGRITPSGTITEFAIPTGGAHPSGIVTGPDGNLWFSEQRLSPLAAIGRIDPSGRITEFRLPRVDTYPGQVVSGPDGRLWFTDGLGAVGTIAPNGHSTRIALRRKTQVWAIAPGPEGDMWYTAAGDSPCMGGGYACSIEIPKNPGIIGRIEPAPVSASIIGSQGALSRRWARLKLSCSGGSVGDRCHGTLRLTAKIGAHRDGHGSRDPRQPVLLARGQYTLPTDRSRTIGLALPHNDSMLLRHGQLGVEAILATAEGATVTRHLMLVSQSVHPQHDHHHLH